MNIHQLTKHVTLAVACVAALVIARVALARADRTLPTPTLEQRVLRSNELEGFVSLFCPLPVTDADAWAGAQLSSRGLRRNGFVAGLRERLHSSALGADAVSAVAELGSADGARREVQDEYAAARRSADGVAEFRVAGLPGARGFTLDDHGTETQTVLFSDGRFQYLVRAGAASRTQVIAAARSLYRRVHGRA
jgi:hypothetical protein